MEIHLKKHSCLCFKLGVYESEFYRKNMWGLARSNVAAVKILDLQTSSILSAIRYWFIQLFLMAYKLDLPKEIQKNCA